MTCKEDISSSRADLMFRKLATLPIWIFASYFPQIQLVITGVTIGKVLNSVPHACTSEAHVLADGMCCRVVEIVDTHWFSLKVQQISMT